MLSLILSHHLSIHAGLIFKDRRLQLPNLDPCHLVSEAANVEMGVGSLFGNLSTLCNLCLISSDEQLARYKQDDAALSHLLGWGT